MAPPQRSQIEHSDVMMLLPDRVGRLKERIDNIEDVRMRDVYATQSKHDQMIASLDDRFADHEARLIDLHAHIPTISASIKEPQISHRGPGSLSRYNLFQRNTMLGELETKPTSAHLPASHGDAASFVLQALGEEELIEEHDGPVHDLADLDDPPGGGQPNPDPSPTQTGANATEEENAGTKIGYAMPLTQGMLDTIAQLDIDVSKLSHNVANSSIHVTKVDNDVQKVIPAVNYATSHIDAIRPTIKNLETSMARLHQKDQRIRAHCGHGAAI